VVPADETVAIRAVVLAPEPLAVAVSEKGAAVGGMAAYGPVELAEFVVELGEVVVAADHALGDGAAFAAVEARRMGARVEQQERAETGIPENLHRKSEVVQLTCDQ
jgi:hypothetical protein